MGRDMDDRVSWAELAAQLRVDSIRSSAAAGSGHPTSSMSAADLLAVLMTKYLHYDFDTPDDPRNDHLIFSKGHASPLLYAVYRAAGAISDEEMLTFRKAGSRIEGHPTPVLPWVDVATGSLGQGLPIAVGVAIAGQLLDRLPYRVWCLCGDSEMAEGSIWEAFESAAFHSLANLTAIVDVNRLGQTGETMHGWDLEPFARRAGAFGWHAIEIDGHDLGAIDQAYAEALATTDRPTVILARTEKGHGVAAVANRNGFHGKPLADAEAAIAELGGLRNISVSVPRPSGPATPHRFAASGELRLPSYEVGTKEATRKAYGDALVALGAARGDVVALDGEVGNSTFSEEFAAAHPDRFIQSYIAEQQMVANAIGLQVRGWRPFAATFAAFLSRAYDFVRMAAISRADIVLTGSHAGVSIGEDGPSQMALEDLASFRAVFGSTVLYPSDPNQTAALMAEVGGSQGDRLPAHNPGEAARHLRAGRAIRGRRQPGRAVDRCRPGDAGWCGDHPPRGARRSVAPRRGGDRCARDRLLFDQADRRGHLAGRRARDRSDHHRGGSLAGGRAGRRGAGGLRGRCGPAADRQAGGAPPAGIRHPVGAAGPGRNRCRPHRRGRPRPRTGEPSMNTLQRLHAEQDQSPWIDFIDRQLIASGRLAGQVGDGIRGLTSNPTIFAKAVASGQYDELIRREIAAGHDSRQIFEEIEIADVGDAADILRPVYDASEGADGFVSIEVEPDLADDSARTLERARHLWSRLARPNVLVKIPATPAGLPAIEAAIAEGINVNITLMFSVEVYRAVARAYIAGLRRRREAGGGIGRIASVASFFVSRVDTKVDRALDAIGTDAALAARGKAAIANAKLAYQAFGEIFGGDEFADLLAAGARVQRCLWASTSTKNPDYRDVMYAEGLIGPQTVDTLPTETIQPFLDHGVVARTLDTGLGQAYEALRAVESQGIRMETVTDELIAEGVAAFTRSFEDLMGVIDAQRQALAPA